MAYALLMLKARNLENQKQRFEIEKNHALTIMAGKKPKYTLADKYRRCIINKKQKIKKCFNRIFSFPEKSWMHRSCVKLRHAGTLENHLLKSLLGFIGGFVLIYIFFMFFVVILNFSLGVATLLCAIFGCIMTVGLAFNETVRQIVFLILPQFFSKRGRQALLAYAFILAITGPCRNTLNNMGIMSESLACGQEQLKQAVKQIIDLIKKPFIAIKEAIKKIIAVVKQIVKKIKEIFLTIKRIVMCIVKVIKSAFSFLGKIFNICSKKVGTPFERCTKVFDSAVTDCYAKLGPMFNWVCSIAFVIKNVCYIVKPLDFICMLLDFINDSVIGVIIKKIKKFVRHVRATFYVRIRFSHSFKFETTASKSMKEATEGMVKEIKERTKKLNDVFSIVSGLTSLFFFVIILKAIVYRHKFLTNERFENLYITNNFREIDFRRAKMEKETILPLNHRERSKYVNIKSCRLTKDEAKQLFKSLAILTMSTFKLGAHIFADYSLWWILDRIRFYGKYTNSVEVPRTVGLKVSGKGFVADLFRSVIKSFNPLGATMDIDTIPCLPDPIPPDLDKYIQIGFMLFLCWAMAIVEPYGLRLRVYVLNYYYPARARERSVWLYNHVLRNRTSFLKFARRQLKRKFFGQKGDKETKITCKELLRARINNSILRFIFKPCLGSEKQEACVLCAQVFRPGDEKQPIRCATPGCPGIYCEPCFTDLQNICTICQDPIQYGDLSDVDEEKDSSEDENSPKYKRRIKEKKNKSKVEIKSIDADTKTDKETIKSIDTDTKTDIEEIKSIQTETKTDIEDSKSIHTETITDIEESKSTDTETKSGETTRDESTPRSKGGQDSLINFSSSSSSNAEYSDSGNSTEYSYSYQYNKNYHDIQPPTRIPFFDLEKQKIPDYVSMDTFQDYLFHTEEDLPTTTIEEKESSRRKIRQSSSDEEIIVERYPLLKKKRKLRRKEWNTFSDSETDSDNETNEQDEYVTQYKKSIRRRIKKWLENKPMFRSASSKEENIPLLDLHLSDEESTKTSTIYTKISPYKTYRKETLTPNDLGFPINNESTVSYSGDINSKLNYLFPNMRYEEINEQPLTPSRSLNKTSSGTRSSEMVLRNRSRYSPSNISDDTMLSTINSEQTSRNYREKIRRYYKTIPLQTFIEESKTDKKNKIVAFFSRLFRNSRNEP